jgi:hypothetical protein
MLAQGSKNFVFFCIDEIVEQVSARVGDSATPALVFRVIITTNNKVIGG